MTTLFDGPVESAVEVPKVSALEVDFPAATLSAVGLKESWRKEVHRPATSTHKWWAKRLGTVFRGILTAAVAEQGEAERLYAGRTSLEGLVVLDPFGGSGTTAVEVAKLGGRVVSLDINPVATLVQRQALQPWDLAALRRQYGEVERSCRAEIDRVHRTRDGRTVLYYFWVATARCPECEQVVRLFDTPVYARNAYPQRAPRAQVVCPQCLDLFEDRYDFEEVTCGSGHRLSRRGNVTGPAMTCSRGHTGKVLLALGDDLPGYEMYAKMVVDARGRKTYDPVDDWDRALYAECERLLADLPAEHVLPEGDLAKGHNTDQALNWNFRRWRDFFNARQAYSLSLLATAVRDLPGSGPEREALCALFSGALEFNNRFCSFKGEGTGAVRHMFSHHILKPERTPLEAHPWGTPYSSGSFSTLLKSRLERAHGYKQEPADLILGGDRKVHRVTGLSLPLAAQVVQNWGAFDEQSGSAYLATCNSASTDLPDGSVDLVVTDPPYMDNVHYAELADFFHAWLRRMRPYEGYPVTDSTRRQGEVQDADPQAFGHAIAAVWSECARVLRSEGILAFTFHQARVAGWVQLVQALRTAGFVVTAVQPVKGEMATSVVKAGAREPSNLDSVVVCRKAAWRGTVHASLEDAYESAVANLANLLTEGVEVGAGDVRSVVRGTLLAHLAALELNLPDRTAEVDRLADAAISMLLEHP